jgi:peroxiredoxin Q/BCP
MFRGQVVCAAAPDPEPPMLHEFCHAGHRRCLDVTVGDMKIGVEVPDFELPDQTGVPRRLSTMLDDGPVVLFFYPAALTAGCTKEACRFRDLAADYRVAGVQRVGISRDDVPKQKRFADTHDLDYPLLSDADGAVAAMFGVRRGALGEKLGAPVKRWTFAIDKDRKIVAAIRSELDMNRHADEALRAFSALP